VTVSAFTVHQAAARAGTPGGGKRGDSRGYAWACVLARRLLYSLGMHHTLEARQGKRNHGQHVARSSFLVATVAMSLALPGLAQAQAPGEADAPQTAPEADAPQTAPETQAMPDAPETQAPAASPATQVPARMQPLVVETSAQPAVTMTGRLDEKDAGFALGGSLLTTGLGLGVMIAGIGGDNAALGVVGFTAAVVGPSFGHFYAGEYGRGLAQSGVRLGAAAMVAGGAAWTVFALFDCVEWGDEERGDCSPLHAAAPLVVLAGVGLGAGSIISSIQDAPKAVHRHNARTRQLVLTPAPIVGPGHSAGVGLQLGGRF